MIRLRTVVLLMLAVTVLAGGAAYGAAAWYWRGGQYVLPRYNQTAALQDILTEHRNRLDSSDATLAAHVSDTGNAHAHDARYVRDSGEDLRVMRGFVRANGTITRGGGFTVTKGVTGSYRIDYDTPFSEVAIPIIASVQGGHVNGGVWGMDFCSFGVTDSSGTSVDTDFMFLIVGPQ